MARTWLAIHPDAASGRRAESEEGARGRQAGVYTPSGGLGSVLSRSEQYLSVRQASQYYDNDAVMTEVRKNVAAGRKSLAAVAWADEARARGLSVPAAAPKAEGHIDAGSHSAASGLVGLGGFGLSLGASAVAGRTISDRSGEGPLKGLEPLVERMKTRHGVTVNVAASVPDHFNPATNTISVQPTSHRSVLAHELGHATPIENRLSKLMMKGYGPGRLASMLLTPTIVAGAIAKGYDTSLQSRDDAIRDTRQGQAIAGGAAALGIPYRYEEARATKNATKYLNELMGRKEAVRGLARLAPAYATYAAAAAGAPLLGIAALQRKRNQLLKEKALDGRLARGEQGMSKAASVSAVERARSVLAQAKKGA